jgi:hypothetical protein
MVSVLVLLIIVNYRLNVEVASSKIQFRYSFIKLSEFGSKVICRYRHGTVSLCLLIQESRFKKRTRGKVLIKTVHSIVQRGLYRNLGLWNQSSSLLFCSVSEFYKRYLYYELLPMGLWS